MPVKTKEQQLMQQGYDEAARDLNHWARVGLTPEDVAHLRRPFHPNAVKWLPIGKLTRNGSQQMMPHIDASLVLERLAEVDPSFTKQATPMLKDANPSDPFGVAHGTPFECTLTVKGVTRSDYGQRDPGAKPDGKYVKEAASDALKRAGLMFGVGAYLRAMPTIYLPKTGGGGDHFWLRGEGPTAKFGGLNPPGKRVLRSEYQKVVTHAAFVEHYGGVVDYGDLSDVDHADEGLEPVEVEQAVSDVEVGVLTLLGGYIGRKTSAEHRAAACRGDARSFAKQLPPILNGVKAALGVDAADLERMRNLAIDAAGGNAEALAQLTDGLDTLKAIAEAGEPDEGEA